MMFRSAGMRPHNIAVV